MSASNKKKLRKEQAVENLTTKQKQEQADAKQLKIYTVSFVIAMILIACIGLGIGTSQFITSRGIIEKSTVAATIGDRKLNTVEFNYYYLDAINNFYDQSKESYGENVDTYIKLIYGLDPAVPLSQQHTDEAKTETWADYFVNMAISQAQNDYAMYDLAMKDNFTLSESSKKSMESTISMLDTYATISGFSNANQYLSAVYGNGATVKTYKAYYERSLIASEYYNAHADTFVYTDEQREAYQADKKATYNSYAYTSCYLTYTNFRGEGTKGEDGKVTYTDEQNNEARKKMEEYAKELAANIKTADDLKNKIKDAPVSKDVTLKVEEEKNVLHDQVSTAGLRDWLSSADRKVGDVAAIPNESTSKDADGKETKVINGYYVVIYNGTSDNKTPMADISYMFVPYEGGVEDEDGEMIYSKEDIEKTKATVEGYLKQWQDGAKTTASFEELATKLIKEKKATTGGPIKDLNPASDFDDAIMEWALDEKRVANETKIVEADDGFYLMIYTAKSKLNYRQYMIENDMRAADFQKWYNDAIAKVPTKVGKLTKIDKDIVLSPAVAK